MMHIRKKYTVFLYISEPLRTNCCKFTPKGWGNIEIVDLPNPNCSLVKHQIDTPVACKTPRPSSHTTVSTTPSPAVALLHFHTWNNDHNLEENREEETWRTITFKNLFVFIVIVILFLVSPYIYSYVLLYMPLFRIIWLREGFLQ